MASTKPAEMTTSSERHLAPYATRAGDSVRREIAEPRDPLRGPFEVDRHRVISCTAFRRLEQKTQVFAPSFHDHFRTRLTHTLETAQIARTLAIALRANEALSETIALAHDLGHPPFGHAGEAGLHDAMAASGGFNHNLHGLRVVEYLEHPFPAMRGLNLTAETRAGLAGHATQYDRPDENEGAHAASVESQIASVADRIAYNHHDLEDAIGAEFVDLDQLKSVALWQRAWERHAGTVANASNIHRIRRIVLNTMLDDVLTDAIESSQPALARFESIQDVLDAKQTVVAPSTSMDSQLTELETFLRRAVYGREEIARMDDLGRSKVVRLFEAYRADLDRLPRRFRLRVDEQGADRVIRDYIAGMTDRFCDAEHRRLLG